MAVSNPDQLEVFLPQLLGFHQAHRVEVVIHWADGTRSVGDAIVPSDVHTRVVLTSADK